MIKSLTRFSCLFVLSALCHLGQEAFAEDKASKNTIEVTDIYMPEIPSVSRTAAIYFTLLNHSKNDFKLVNVSSDASNHAMIHRSQELNGVAKMQHIDELIIPAESKLEFQVGDYHIMLMGLDHELLSKPFKVTLEFANQLSKSFTVEKRTRNH